MEREIIHQVSLSSMDGDLNFLDVVRTLKRIGVESYHVDLLENRRTYHLNDGKIYAENFEFEGPAVAEKFSQEKVIDAVFAIQAQRIRYKDFLNFLMLAGVANYSVFIDGSQTIYFGRKGELYVEKFSVK